ncbi:PP2C family protein-serine/threonine phosphatase [Salipiger mucosus]|uniref:Serine phosphatase RsbU, regulator of sigma subunit n=1 Tax=Salipiger mucosus DSM 16094 TaxID=1123237 RepID=S9RWQ5_9RHOB|nr:fused response regulator/phosphatase [Salipiger mucosus]EPX82455.1 Serine phosphatase RsbU, regulator of sigma subunit [Salipiger mucosus DSM 16094]
MLPETSDHADAGQARALLRRVLVVDDSPLQLKILSSMLRRRGFEVWQARSGEEALEICAAQQPDAVLSDWMMPGMDGLDFCRRFRALPRETYGYFILLTSKSEKGEIARGLDAGADDFLTKPIHAEELHARINAGARILLMERRLSETLGRLRDAYDAIDRDLRQARTIQQALVPRRSRRFGDTQVSLLLKPCGHVGGDLVGSFAQCEREVGVYSIDVSGHGITSALMTARVAGYLGGDFPDQNVALERMMHGTVLRPPEEVARRLNERLAADPGVAEYLTMAYATLRLDSGRVDLVQAGHPPPLLLRADGTQEFIGAGGLPIGLVPEAGYERLRFGMRPGDRLLLYSDGLTEAMRPDGAMLEQEGLLRLALACRDATGTEFLDDLFWRLTRETRAGTELEDDVSAALIEYGGA